MILGQKRSCSSINHLGLFCHFLLGLEYQVKSQASLLHHIMRTGPRMRPPQTQKLRLMLHSVQLNMFINLSLRKR